MPKCHRPIDTTALFLGAIFLVVALIAWLVGLPTATRGCLLAAPFFIAWQIWTWVEDARIKRNAIEWCDKYYPQLQSGALYSFINSISRDAGGKLDHLNPETPLLDLDWFAIGSEKSLNEGAIAHKAWLGFVLDDACVQGVEVPDMSGKTLGDAVVLITNSQSAG